MEGRNDLAVCLTSYATSGNTHSRLTKEQLDILHPHIVSHWNSGVSLDASDFHGHVRDACQAKGIRSPTLKTIAKHLSKKQDCKKRLLNTGGLRAYQARKNASDPRVRSMPAQARFLVLEIDSTKCDNRVMPDIASILLFDAPTLYVGIDGCTTDVMASAFVFGPAKRDGLALLLRDFLRRHGRLPHIIKLDRGPDNKNDWIEGFCDRYNIILIHDPTAGSRSKGDIENALGRANASLSHKLLGSTAPDQAGRKVDGRFKSYRTARHQFVTIRREMETVLFDDFARTPRGDGISLQERTELSTILFPSVG